MIKVKQKQTGKRLDVFVLEHLQQLGFDIFSRNFLTKNWAGLVTVNGEFSKPSYKLKYEDEVEIDMEKVKQLKDITREVGDIKAQTGKLDILFENQDFLILEKPKGIVVHPGKANPKDTLANYVKGYLESKGELDASIERSGIVHRLDKGVSGIMLFAKNLKMQKHLQKQFENHEVKKIYLADIEYKQLKRDAKKYFVKENHDIEKEIEKLEKNNFKFDSSWFKVQGYIVRSSRNRVKMEFRKYAGRKGKKAISYIKPVNEKQLLIVIKTGRMHQIRATLEYLGIGIKGDTLYGLSKSSTMPDSIALKSIYLSFNELNGDDFTIIRY